MSPLEQAIENAYQNQGDIKFANKMHISMLTSELYLPIEKSSTIGDPKALFFYTEDQMFVPVFDNIEYLHLWAGEEIHNLEYIKIKGADLITGLSPMTYLCLNIDTKYYKEFAPDEIAKLQSTIAKIM